MTPDIPAIETPVPEITQIGIVVRDLDAGMERYAAVLGLTDWEVHRFEPPTLTDTTVYGEAQEYSMALALGFLGETMIELIEPLTGESLYTEHLAEHGEGLHHVACFAFDDPWAVVEEFEAVGMPVIQSGDYGGTPYWYFDTREALDGVIFETAANVDDMPDPDRVVEL
ncbi:MAG: VOC family protein [Halanaeroarchaeum sp.]